jgi:hypothetical protein
MEVLKAFCLVLYVFLGLFGPCAFIFIGFSKDLHVKSWWDRLFIEVVGIINGSMVVGFVLEVLR